MILVIAEKTFHRYYRNLSFENEKIKLLECENVSQIIRTNQATLIIIDCGFNIDMGLQILREAKNISPSTPVILLTDESSEEVAIKAFRSGVREYFPKPVELITLQETIESILRIKKQSKEKRSPLLKVEITQSEFFSNLDWSHIPFRLFKAVNYIEKNLSKKITLDELANISHLSKYYFARNFQNIFGMGPIEYANYCRIQRAKILIQREELSITEVGFAAGFNSYSSFFRYFKKIMGISPEKYKESISKR